MVLDCDQSLLTIEFEEGKYRNWQDAWYSKKSVNQLSHFFSGFLRHWGCTWKGNQSCDSGGWFLWMKISQMLCKGDKLCCAAAAFHDVDHIYMRGSTPVFMLHALIPANTQGKTRFQLLVEVNHATSMPLVLGTAVHDATGSFALCRIGNKRAAIEAPRTLPHHFAV